MTLLITFLGNLVDTAATLYLSSNGFTEANPIMAQLLNYPILFALVKILVMSAVLVYLWRSREYKLARVTAMICATVYGLIALYYLWFFTFLL